MIKMIKILILLITSYSLNQVQASDFDEALITIETRKTAMQVIWERVKRLSPYVELKEKIDYNKDLAVNDAQEIVSLLKKTKNLWSEKSNLSPKGFTNATPAVWALPDYFNKLYSNAEQSALRLNNAISEDNIDDTVVAMCNLGQACGTCHANFRRLLTNQLANEVSGWSGKYIKDCQ
jgi:cytochrome c556